MNEYEQIRKKYMPEKIRYLLIAESPPPPAEYEGSRHFYRTDRIRLDDRLYLNTMKALYTEAEDKSVEELEQGKEAWLRRFQGDGFYMTEALEQSVVKKVDKKERQRRIRENLPRLIARVKELANNEAKIILIKSNVFEVATEPLRQAGFNVSNKKLLDYPGFYNQKAYREKLAAMVKESL